MRICRLFRNNHIEAGFFEDAGVVPLQDAVSLYNRNASNPIETLPLDDPLALLPHGNHAPAANTLAAWLDRHPAERDGILVPHGDAALRTPVAAPPKILLLAGNYAAHIEEEGQIAVERQETFPYVFMKPRTALNHPGGAIPIPKVSPDHIDYECELGVVIGKTARHVSEDRALEYVAGYTVINDISDRRYRPNPERRARERDAFFDWLHGKWHDGFCPVGPAVASAETIGDPQSLSLCLTVNGEVRQKSSTSSMIFPVAAVVSFISQWVTLEPGDLIATGTPAGVGAPTGRFLRAGDRVEATIQGIGTLKNTLVEEGG